MHALFTEVSVQYTYMHVLYMRMHRDLKNRIGTVYSIRKDGKEQCTCMSMYNIHTYTHRWIYPNNTVFCTNYFIIHNVS